MYVCLCRGITDKQIAALVQEKGVGSVRELKAHLDVSTDCGICVKAAKQVIDDTIIDESLFQNVG
ncbi:(2Fe-2S)-binding protein [Thalassotalea agarivorans]|uniref:Bacterioferritin-associated ferredoxin n=1 Tax=Thalassotalea agarivorans TaxID=349064 RepID=A0A1I0BJ10_THASX|nr:(2Fe-2S)-binding protein [Thalassotalea agarivorans]SET06547.1 bacterioferritin-associated ferredoxin [Thalassotalea agarivorans]